ncbi:lymphotoxin-alpha [Pempheris klunzingeri]|uniref:lymphotoxin-alpha n=1 Tax=Pempheris klunzingeri TaxID=3127111 RepID=UPI00397FE85B
MECHSRSSHKYLLLQVWCGLLTVAMVVMATLLTSIKPKSTQWAPKTSINPKQGCNVGCTDLRCDSCSLSLRNNSIHCTEHSLYFIYAQVTFNNLPTPSLMAKSVIMIRNATIGKTVKILVEGIYPNTTVGSVWVATIVSLTAGDSVSLEIRGDFRRENTFWGAYKLH